LLSENSKGLRDSSIKYFLTQALASVLFLLSLVVSPISGQVYQPLTFLLVIALLVKLGAAPFHA
jgi:NADH:ubiquinone oxidoreductase subunit 2 (subunit N)